MRKVIFLFMLSCLAGFFMATIVAAEKPGTIVGEITFEDSDSCRGMVSLWPVSDFGAYDHERTDLIPPWVSPVKADCSFQLDVSPGSYYVWVVLRTSPGGDFGPLRPGDRIFLLPETDGEPQPIHVVAGQAQHLGSSSASREFPGYPDQVETGVTGVLLDEAGSPLVDHVVQAFATMNLSGQPLAVSGPSDIEGYFKLRLSEGSYYLLARDQAGFGMPLPGGLFGVYGGGGSQERQGPAGGSCG